MSTFTPTIKAVRDAYAYAAHDPSEDDPDSDEHYREFDRWLAQHDAEVRKQVAEEIAEALKRHADAVITFDDATLESRRTFVTAARIAREIGGAS